MLLDGVSRLGAAAWMPETPAVAAATRRGAPTRLFLTFNVGEERYALDVAEVAEVLPHVNVRSIPQSEPGVAGVINYRGAPVPVIDLSALTLGRKARKHLSTRIVLVRHLSEGGATHMLGLIAENATATLRCDPMDFVASGVVNPAAPYLGPVIMDARGLIHRMEVSRLLPATLRDSLFRETGTPW